MDLEPGGAAETRADAPAPEDADGDPLTGRVAELEARLAEVLVERDERAAEVVRRAADLDNVRKRKAQELADCRRYAGDALFRAILPALDNLSRAVEHLPADGEDQLAAGLRLTLRQLEEGLASEGIRPVASVGTPFDPAVHEAVATEPGGAVGEDTVVAELRPGYRYHDRLVRPAQVRVARAGEPAPIGAGEPAGDPDAGAPDPAGPG